MSLDDLYNHLKVYESEVQKKSKSNSQNMAFISSAKHNSRNEEVNTASVSTASTNVSPASANIRVAIINQDTAYDAASASDGAAKKKGRTAAVITDDMQKRKNDVKARTTLMLALPDEHQLRFNEEESIKAAVWKLQSRRLRNIRANFLVDYRSDLDTMSLDDLYNHLKVYESEVQKKSKSNSQNMAFISSAKHNSRNEEVNTASVSTASTNVSPASANIRVAIINQDTACAYIAS
nr:hypothetical protein [Tanacetum cinerariifolium]